MNRSFDDHTILYPESDDDRELLEEQIGLRTEALGAHKHYGKPRNLFISKYKASKITRTRKATVDTSSKSWKEYVDGRISFSEMKKQLKLFR